MLGIMTTYLSIRALHVLCGALWAGFAVFGAVWLMPMMQDLGPDAAKAGQSLERRGFMAAVPVVALLAILSGAWLYWRFTGGFGPEASATPAAMAFGTGGVLAILSWILGGLFIGRSMAKAGALSIAAAKAPEAERGKMLAQAAALRRSAMLFNRLVALLLVIIVTLMSVAHYL